MDNRPTVREEEELVANLRERAANLRERANKRRFMGFDEDEVIDAMFYDVQLMLDAARALERAP